MYYAFRNYSSTCKLSDWELKVMQASGGSYMMRNSDKGRHRSLPVLVLS
jgi:hypothetical protein